MSDIALTESNHEKSPIVATMEVETMKQGLRDIDWGQAGAELARSDDDEQADFFKAFVRECASWGTTYQIERQLAGVNQKLTLKEKQTLAMLGYSEGNV